MGTLCRSGLLLLAAAAIAGCDRGEGAALAPDELLFVRLEVAADGTLWVQGRPGSEKAVGRLRIDDLDASGAALDAMRAELRRLTSDRALRDPIDYSRRGLHVVGQSDTPWGLVQWIMICGRGSPIRALDLRLSVAGDAARTWRTRLPEDGNLFPEPPPRRVLRLVVSPGIPADRAGIVFDAYLGARVGWAAEEGQRDPEVLVPMPGGIDALRPWLAAHAGEGPLVVEVETPLPDGARVPLGPMIDLLRAVSEDPAREVDLVGAPLPVPPPR